MKFETGDRVKIPKTKSKGSSSHNSFLSELSNYRKDYLLVDTFGIGCIFLKRDDNKYLTNCAFIESDIEHYEEPKLELSGLLVDLDGVDENNLRFKTEKDKSIIYDSKTDKTICMYFDNEARDWLLGLLNSIDANKLLGTKQ